MVAVPGAVRFPNNLASMNTAAVQDARSVETATEGKETLATIEQIVICDDLDICKNTIESPL